LLQNNENGQELSIPRTPIVDNTQLSTDDLLHEDVNNAWSNNDISQAKYNINDNKLIDAGCYVVGINGQSLQKNSIYDIISTIPNPKFSVSPWNTSTIEPDLKYKQLDVRTND
jgi:hypothetical protein